MKKLFVSCLLFGAIWFLIGCRGENPPSTLAPAVTIFSSATSSRTHSPSATHTPTSTFTPTSTPSPTPFEVLPLMTSHEVYPEATPISTPSLGAENYQLKSWSETEALALIHTMEVYAHDNDIIVPAHARFEFPESYGLVELAIREMKFRFPNSAYQKKVDWRLAMANVIQGESESDEWILKTIEDFLNQHPLTALNGYLVEHGFLVAKQVEVFNLLGDNRPALVLRVQAQDKFGTQGLVFALQEDAQGIYQLFPIHSFWTIIASDERIMNTLDNNKNGVPEVVLENSLSSGSMCGMNVYIFEWREGEFVDLTQGQIKSNDCELWSFGEPDLNGIDTISIPDFYGREDIYKWNGMFYELSERRFSLGAPFCVDYTLLLDTWPDYTRGIAALQTVLDSWTDEDTGNVGTVCQDYLRFQMGMTYAYHDQYSKALAIFQNLAKPPANAQLTYISSATKSFLQHYKNQSDLYKSCLATQTMLDELEPSWQEQIFMPICDWDTIFPLFLKSLNPSEVSDLIQILEQAGTQVYNSTTLDIDGDSDLDWIVVASHGSRPADVWAFLNLGESFQALSLGYYIPQEELSSENPFKAETILLPGSEEIFTILWVGDGFDIYRLGQPYEENLALNVFTDWDVQTYEFQEMNHTWGLEISYTPSASYANPVSFYYWNDVKRDFQLLPFDEEHLFTDSGPREILPYLERLVSTLATVPPDDTKDRAHFLYLLGLTYELTGDNQQALEAYWTIWHDHPNSGYARMACSKIENCVP